MGAAKVDITPEYPVRMYGYASRTTESEGVAGRLWAGALAIGGDGGEGPAVLLCVDCGSVPSEIRAEVLRRVQSQSAIRPERFVLANSHTHAGPNVGAARRLEGEERERMERYAGELADRLEEVVLEALAARRPGRLAWTQGAVGFAANRRVLTDGRWTGFGAVPEGAVDHSLPLLRVTDEDDQPIALVVNYACHCTTMRNDFVEIHGDWAAAAQEAIEADHPGAVALVTVGCGADSDPYPHGRSDPDSGGDAVALSEEHGRAIADEVQRLMAGPFRPVTPELVAREAPLEISFEPSLEELERLSADSPAAERLLQQLEDGESLPSPQTIETTVWAFGEELAMVFLSDEMVVDIALRLKRELDGSRLWISAYCNSISRYVVSARLIEEGGYEVQNSLSSRISLGNPELVQPPVEDRIVEHVRALLPESYRSNAP